MVNSDNFTFEQQCELLMRGTQFADEVDLDPRDAELLLHHLGHVIDGPVAHDEVEVRRVGVGEMVDAGIAAERGDHRNAALLKQTFDLEGIAADIVLAQQIDLEVTLLDRVIRAHNMLKNSVVGDVVSGGLADAFIPFTGKTEHVDSQFLFHFPTDGMHIVSDKPHGTGGKHSDGLGVEIVVRFGNGLFELFLTAEDNLLILHVGGKAIIDKVLSIGTRIGLIAAGQPAVEPAAHRSMGNIDDIAGGPQHDALASGIAAPALAD